jgi:hypothetical protein
MYSKKGNEFPTKIKERKTYIRISKICKVRKVKENIAG